jgi:hypothetical protein
MTVIYPSEGLIGDSAVVCFRVGNKIVLLRDSIFASGPHPHTSPAVLYTWRAMNRASVVLNRRLGLVVLAFVQTVIAQNLPTENTCFGANQSCNAINLRLRAVSVWPTITGAVVIEQAIPLGGYGMLVGTACGSNGTR